jgi:hypothetical protein
LPAALKYASSNAGDSPSLIVEAAAHVVGGQERGRVDVEREQIADRVAVFRSI